MTKIRTLLHGGILVFLLFFPFAFAASSDHALSRLVVGTSWIKTVVEDLTDHAVQPTLLIPAPMCPGHTDLRPSDLEKLEKCSALLIHVWQRDLPNVAPLLSAGVVSAERVRLIEIQGNWMIPEVQTSALKEIAKILSELDPQNAQKYSTRAAQRSEEIVAYAQKLKTQLLQYPLSQDYVVCQTMQEPFVKWLGFPVVVTFERAEDRSAASVAKVVESARKSKVRAVIDNLQSGDPQTGEMLSRMLDVPLVVLTNFPEGLEGTETWEKMISHNLNLILKALGYSNDLR